MSLTEEQRRDPFWVQSFMAALQGLVQMASLPATPPPVLNADDGTPLLEGEAAAPAAADEDDVDIRGYREALVREAAAFADTAVLVVRPPPGPRARTIEEQAAADAVPPNSGMAAGRKPPAQLGNNRAEGQVK